MKAEVVVPWDRQTIVLHRIPKRTVVRWTAALLAAIALAIVMAAGGWMKAVHGPAAPNPTGAAPQNNFVTDAAQCASPAPDEARCPPANTVQLPRMTIDEVFMELSRRSR